MAESKADQIKKLELSIDQVARTQSVLNTNQIQKIFNSTPKKYKYTRKAKGGGQWTYIKASYVRKVLDSVFGFDWSFEIMTDEATAFDMALKTRVVTVRGRLTGNVYVDGVHRPIIKEQFGRAEVKFKRDMPDQPLDFGNDMKAAASDALKKCASLLGIGADVYEADEFMEIEIVGSDENSDRAKATKKKLKEAQAVLESEGTKVGGENE